MNPRGWLSPAGAAFGAAGALRARLYADGILRVHGLEGPVISVGNLAVGGRGKTPLVARVAALLRDSGHQVAVLSRGYGGRRTAARLGR
jgi:tetraacyldisaccharide 4'-kinase